MKLTQEEVETLIRNWIDCDAKSSPVTNIHFIDKKANLLNLHNNTNEGNLIFSPIEIMYLIIVYVSISKIH